jgi:uncharacterized protein YndB with AHSA1/START domain
MTATRHVFQIFIRADQDAVWQAITDPDFTRRYFHATAFETTLDPGAPFRYVLADGSTAVEGTIEEIQAPRRLVTTWRVLYDAAMAAEPPSRVEWSVEPAGEGLTRVVVEHVDLGRSPLTSRSVGAGWPWVLGSLKSVLETGAGLPRATSEPVSMIGVDGVDGETHRRFAVEANDAAWELIGRDDLDADEAEDLMRRVYAAAYHWARAARRGPENEARAEYMIAKANWRLGRGDAALHHARRCLAATSAAGLTDFDLAYAHEVMTRALLLVGRTDEAATSWAAARTVPIADAEDEEIVDADFADVALP